MKKVTLLLSICFLTALTAGCKSTAKIAATETTSNCQIASSNKVEMAFSEAQASLSNRECWMGFDSQFTSLLNIAKGDPNKEHQRKFAEFLRWSESSGIISKMQLREKYTRFFTPYFTTLPKNQSNCKAGQNLEALTRAMDKEMLDKKRGILEAMANADMYNKAKRDRDAILLVVAAAGEACQVN